MVDAVETDEEGTDKRVLKNGRVRLYAEIDVDLDKRMRHYLVESGRKRVKVFLVEAIASYLDSVNAPR